MFHDDVSLRKAIEFQAFTGKVLSGAAEAAPNAIGVRRAHGQLGREGKRVATRLNSDFAHRVLII
jgi:hypothetical protein